MAPTFGRASASSPAGPHATRSLRYILTSLAARPCEHRVTERATFSPPMPRVEVARLRQASPIGRNRARSTCLDRARCGLDIEVLEPPLRSSGRSPDRDVVPMVFEFVMLAHSAPGE